MKTVDLIEKETDTLIARIFVDEKGNTKGIIEADFMEKVDIFVNDEKLD